MVPLARSLQRAGHEVAFATAERFCRRVVAPAGLAAFPAGLSAVVVHERTMELPRVAALADDDFWRLGAHMFAEVAAPAKVEDLVGVIEGWRADLVVHDMTDFAGPVAAAACGIPWVNHSFGALQPEEFWDLAAELVAPTWGDWGVDPGPLGGMFRLLYLDLCPPGFQSEMIGRVPVSRPLRPVTFDNPRGERPPAWLDQLGPGPTAYVTLGTVANHTPRVFETVLDAMAGGPANVIVTVGPDREPADLGPLAPNVHVERYLPQSLVLPSCDLVVCHSGSGTTWSALSCGLPLLALPQEANQFWNADRVATLGVGEQIRPAEMTVRTVGKAVGRLLEEPSYQARARLLAGEIAAIPGPDEAVAALEALVAG